MHEENSVLRETKSRAQSDIGDRPPSDLRVLAEHGADVVYGVAEGDEYDGVGEEPPKLRDAG